MKPPIIAFCTMSPLHIGGAETNMLQIAAHLRHRYQIIFVAPMSAMFENKVRQLGVNCTKLSLVSKFSFPTIYRLATIFRNKQVSIVHTHDTRGGLLGRIAGKMARVKVVHTVHMPAFFQTTQPIKRWVYERIESLLNHRFTDRIIFVSNTIKEISLNKFCVPESKVIHIPNGVQIDLFREIYRNKAVLRENVRKELGILDSETVVCWTGRITIQKGLDILIKAARILSKKGIKYLIIGDGPEQTSIEALAHKYGLENQFIFTGFKSQHEVYQYMCASDLFVFPSRYECLPYAILEAMALGLPCVVTNVGGNSELVKNKYNGYIVRSEDACELSEAISKLIDDKNLRKNFADKTLELVQKYDVQDMVKKVEEIYNSLITI